jgi:hypothetical protein
MTRTVRYIGTTLAVRRDYTLRDLIRITGLRVRTLQEWGDNNVLITSGRSLHAGRGMPRKFPLSEVIIGTLLTPLSQHGVGLGWLKRTSEVLRQALSLEPGQVRGVHYEEGTPEIGRMLQNALRGIGKNYLLFAYTEERIVIEPLSDVLGEPLLDPRGIFASGEGPAPTLAFLLDLRTLARIFDR